MEKTFGALGRTIIVAGIVPVVFWLTLHLPLLAWLWPASAWQPLLCEKDVPPGPCLVALAPQAIGALLAVGALGGALLIALNGAIIRWYEGGYGVQRRVLLRSALERNLRRHAAQYGRLLGLRRMVEEAQTRVNAAEEYAEADEWRFRLNSALVALDEAYRDLELQPGKQTLPLREELVLPTALGNTYAVIEEYPEVRYGMDSLVYWTPLLTVIPQPYLDRVGQQKTTCDMLLNLSLLVSLLAVELAVMAAALTTQDTVFRLALAVAAILGLAAAYGLYRAAVAETRILGRLITGAFDLYRHALLRRFRLPRPASLLEERQLWQDLALFLRRGEAFYYPATEAPAPGEQPVQR